MPLRRHCLVKSVNKIVCLSRLLKKIAISRSVPSGVAGTSALVGAVLRSRLVSMILRPPWLQELREPQQTIGGRCEGEGPSDALGAAQHRSPHATDRLHPAERLLDPLADALARPVASMARRAPVDHRAAATLVVLRDVWAHVHGAQAGGSLLHAGPSCPRLLQPRIAPHLYAVDHSQML